MRWLELFRRKQRTPPRLSTVTFDKESVTCRRPGGLVESVRWSDLETVSIQTTDQGPAVDDVFWVLGGNESGCVVPSESEGMQRLLPRLQCLPGFDNNAVIAAMACAEYHEFVCWRRPAVGEPAMARESGGE
jgi:hypothetical protein